MRPLRFQLISYPFFFIVLFSCNNTPEISNSMKGKPSINDYNNYKSKGQLYANENGTIEIIHERDSAKQVIFRNDEGDFFECTMIAQNQYSSNHESLIFLKWNAGGLVLQEASLTVLPDTALSKAISIQNLYKLPFYKINETVQFIGKINHHKGGPSINGIYLKNRPNHHLNYVEIKGIIQREPYPLAYYSTPESPQGMFGDTSIVHYRLILNEYEVLRKFEEQTFKGTTMNIDKQAAFIYEFADSEAFYLNNKAPWKEEELHKTIEIKATLVQFIAGKSMLMDWEIMAK